MNDQTAGADHREQDKSYRQNARGGVMNDQAEEIDADQGREFGLAGVALAELVGEFDNLQTAAGRKDNVDQDLEAVGRKTRSQARDDFAPNHEEPAHRIGDGGPCDSLKNHAPISLSAWRAGERPPPPDALLIRAPIARLPEPLASASYIWGRMDSSC